jgi:hypothetical protein
MGGPVGYTLHVVPREAGAKEGAIGEVLGTLGGELLRGLEQKVLQAESHPPQLLTPNDGGGSDFNTQVMRMSLQFYNVLKGPPQTLSHRAYSFLSFRKPTPPQNCQLIVYYY